MLNNIHPVTISNRACEEIHHILKRKGIPSDYGLRVGIRGGGCSKMLSLILGFDKRKETDLSYEVDGITVYVDKKHAMYLLGKQIDFIEEEDARGFTFRNEASTAK